MATKRFRSKWFCDSCYKEVKQHKAEEVYAEHLLWTSPEDKSFQIYEINTVKLR